MSASEIHAGLVKSVIIVTGGRSNYAAAGALDQLIRDTLSLGKQPVVVLGPDGDDLLRSCSLIENCEMVFDPNFQGGIFSGVKAGLEAVNGAAFVIPLGAESVLKPTRWVNFEKALLEEHNRNHVIRPVATGITPDGTPLYPLMITPQGILPLKALPSSSDWLSSDRIKIADFNLVPRPPVQAS
jgi:hypothetical protein